MRIEDHQEEAEPDDQSNSPDDQAAAEPDDQSNSPGDQAADQPDGQERLHRVHHRQPEDAAYLNVACRVVEQRDEESRESHHVQVRAERFGLRQLNQREQLVLQEQLVRQEPR